MPGQPTPAELPDIGARVTFEWMGDKAFVVERWTVPIPEAPDGLAVIGWDKGRRAFLQHYFSPFEFSQRFSGTVSADGKRIAGTWEIANDHKTWEKDFDQIYTRVG